MVAAVLAPSVVPAAARSGHVKAAAAAGSVRSDFDGDGFADLAVGRPGDTVGSLSFAGVVTVLYGTANGPGTGKVQTWSAATPGVKGLAIQGGRFGKGLVSADFNGDGIHDLAIGATGESAGSVTDAGGLHVLFGSPDGLTADGNQRWTQDSPGIPGKAESDEEFGRDLAVGNFGRGPQDDLAIGIRSDQVNGISEAGGVNVLYGTPHGLGSNGAQLWTQASPGIPSVPGEEEGFGHALVAASLGKGPDRDLVIGTPQDHVGGLTDVGTITVLFGSSNGLTATGRQFINEDALGTPIATGDAFGSALAAGNFGGSAAIDVAVGARGAAVDGTDGAGAAFVVFGGTNGLSLSGAQRWTQAASGTGQTEAGDFFGDQLAAGNFGKSALADLAVGVPLEDVNVAGNDRVDAGAVTLLYGSPDGLTAAGAQGFVQSSIGVGAAVEADDLFGFVLLSLPLGHGPQADLVMGDPLEDIGDVFDSGAVFVMFGSSTGLTTTDAQSWNADTAGVPGEPEVAGRFGEAVA
jgi:hypothetical protein